MQVKGGSSLWMVVNPDTDSVVYIAAKSKRDAEMRACKKMGEPQITVDHMCRLGYRAVKVTALTFEGETK